MDCSRQFASLLQTADLPEELKQILREGSVPHILEATSATALLPRYTDAVFTHLQPVFAELCCRWNRNQLLYAIPALGRILPYAPHLRQFLRPLLRDDHGHPIRLPTLEQTLLQGGNEPELSELLLGLFRLLRLDNRTYSAYVHAANLQLCLSHPSIVVRYLATRVLCLFTHAADAATSQMLHKYTEQQPVKGSWDDTEIDYAYLNIWERKRFEAMSKAVEKVREQQAELDPAKVRPVLVRTEDMSPHVVAVQEVLLPRLDKSSRNRAGEAFVAVPSAISNLNAFATTVLGGNPTLLTGLPGTGKTFIVNYVADLMGKRDSMVTLHLNEQTDAKLLLGLYTTDPEAGTFAWSPGVLTTAVKEGRWLVIEDLDHAPDAVISVLLPLLESGELHLPSRGEVIRAAEGFRIVATMRTIRNAGGTETLPRPRLVGWRLWQRIQLQSFSLQEAKDIMRTQYPEVMQHSNSITSLFERVTTLLTSRAFTMATKNGSMRPFHFADLLKWCDRVSRRLRSSKGFDDSGLDNMFLDAVDVFASSIRETDLHESMVENIALALNIDPQRRDHLIRQREISVSLPKEGSKPLLRVGRAHLPVASSIKRRLDTQNLALNRQTKSSLERIAVAVSQNEPLLLVGETGAGKTSTIQYLSDCTRATLHVFNLSQQSEGSDLLGSFRPVSMRAVMQPLKDQFEALFSATFGQKANEGFLSSLSKAFAKSQWSRVFKLWANAIERVKQSIPAQESAESRPHKKIKREHSPPEYERPRKQSRWAEWEEFAEETKVLEQKMKISRGSPLFAFVEGNLVKAVRNGDWVLLDEINLAPMETLEALAELLGSGYRNERFLMLSESGEVKRIEAHPNFRLFAAMNPATDVGKRDLPGGIRSRFTEFYFESPDRDPESLLMIVSSYLRDPHFDKRSATDAAGLYQKIQSLAESNRIVDGAGRRPHYSLRSLTRALRFAAAMKSYMSGRDALNEGFQMSFSTCLDNNSAKEVMHLITASLLGAKAGQPAARRGFKPPSDGSKYVQIGARWLRCGDGTPEEVSDYIITPFIQSNLDNLVRAISARRYPILLQGPTSSGKTSMIEYLARRSGNTFLRINNHEHTDLQEYLGSYVSKGGEQVEFQDGALVQAMRKGSWIVLDELNLAPGEVLEALNRLLDDNRELFIPETQETVLPHPNFVLFATQNPAGLYGGRKHLSRAFRNRFLEMHFDDIPTEELSHILYQRCSIPQSWANRIVAVYQRLSQLRQQNRLFEQKSFATLRDLFRWGGRPATVIEELAENGYMLLAERVRKEEERAMVKLAIEECMSKGRARVTIDLDRLYNGDLSSLQVEYPRNNEEFVDTSAMRRMITLLAHAFRNNEPVLLIGETGCGKTTACQIMAMLKAKELLTVNAHQNTEAGDLLGSQRPIRNRASIEAELITALRTALDLQGLLPSSAATLDDLLRTYDGSATDKVPKDVQKAIDENRLRQSKLFEWSDGPLVQALRQGHFFLLDEISLADDSVLERLNSVLEPKREIYLAEKGGEGQSVRGSDGFQFMATMNPGGDYGKRELSPALRNRFTEIWIPNMTDQGDLLVILEGRLAPYARQYSSRLLQFAKWFGQQYNTGTTESISLRRMLAWVQFINSFAEHEIQEAIVHGAALVFIDALGANPAGLISVNQANVEAERSRCLSTLSELFEFNATSIYHSPTDIRISDTTVSIGLFELHRPEVQVDSGDFSMIAPTTRSNVLRIARAMRLPRPILLEGAPGVGKTTLVLELARLLGKQITRINLSEQTDVMDLFGSDVPSEGSELGKFVWNDAPFLTAMKRGDWVLLDEMNLAAQPVLEGLNACLDHRGEAFVPELNQAFQKHPEFLVFAAQNPHHQGNGRKGLPASFVDRFTVVYADSMVAKDFELICKQSFPDIPYDSISKVVLFSEKLGKQIDSRRFGNVGGPWEFNLRDIRRWLELFQSQRQTLPHVPLEQYFNLICLQRFRTTEDVEKLQKLALEVFGLPPPPSAFHNLSQHSYQVGLALLPRSLNAAESSVSLTSLGAGLGPLVESVAFCIDRAWPVLLTGPSGCGKSHLIRYMSAMAGAKLVNLSLNADTDSSDLIGGYEQYDAMRHIATAVGQLRSILQVRVTQIALQDRTKSLPSTFMTVLFELLSDLSSFPQSDIKSILHKVNEITGVPGMEDVAFLASRLHVLSSQLVQQQHARFEWVDGLVIEAMSQGHWLVLDQVNLCSPSVLDRLNSLLEPGRTLSISENSTEAGEPRVIHANPSFRIFMTMDPLHGELSRAMRNRSVELHLQKKALPLPTYFPQNLEATTYRLERFSALQSTYSDAQSKKAVELICEHLSPDELQSTDDLLNVVPQLQLLDTEQAAEFRTFLLSLKERLGYSIPRWRHIQEGSLRIFGQSFTGQPINSLNNEIFFYNQLRPTAVIEYEFDLYGLAAKAAQFHAFLLHVRERLYADKPVTQLELSLSLSGRKPSSALQLSRIAEYLFGIDQVLTSMLPSLFCHMPSNPGALRIFHDFLIFIDQVLSLVQPTDRAAAFDMGLFNCLNFLGRSLLRGLAGLGGLLREFGHKILDLAVLIDGKGGLQSGLCMDKIWSNFRPVVPTSTTRLQALHELETVADRLDSVMLRNYTHLQPLTGVRKSVVKALSEIWKQMDGGHESLVALIRSEMAHLNELADSPHGFAPYLAHEFQEMFRFTNSHEFSSGDVDTIGLAVLSGIRTKDICFDDVQSNRLVRQLARLNKIIDDVSDSGISNPNEHLAVRVLVHLTTLPDLRLKSLKGMLAETRILGKQLARQPNLLCSDRTAALDSVLQNMLDSILQSFKDSETGNASGTQNGVTADDSHSDPSAQFFIKIHSQFFDPVLEYLESSPGSPSHNLHQASVAWVSFGLGCIYLMVPNVEYDPSTKELLLLDRFSRTKSDLLLRIHGLESYLDTFGASTSSLRLHMLQARLVSMGEASANLPRLPRPEKSQMHLLQRDFNSLLVLSRGIEATFLNSSDPQVAGTTLDNLFQISSRLKHSYRHYGDITFLVNGFIHCLIAGLTLAKDARTSTGNTHSRIPLQRHVPLLGDEAAQFDLRNHTKRLKTGDDAFVSALLQVASFHTSAQNDFLKSRSNGEVVHEIFLTLDQKWASKLSTDQAAEAARTKWYAYRGSQPYQELEEEDELAELFPVSGEDGDADQQRLAALLSPRRVCSLHRALFLANGDATDRLAGLLRHMSECLGGEDSIHDGSSAPKATVFPLLVRKISDLIRDYTGQDAPGSRPNFYNGSNAAQARKFLDILESCRGRFQQINMAWPDHAVPLEVLSLCTEINDSLHDEPLAKLIQKAEKVHRAVYRWQQVASREYSAAVQYDQLTALIIDWRRIELASWSRLFDDEFQASKERAKDWWFLGFRNIITIPEGLVLAGETSPGHLAELLGGVDEFLSTAPFGQFAERLRILTQIRDHLQMRSHLVPGLAMFADGLSNVLNFYALFGSQVQTSVKENRQVLEKEIKTVIQLASWKDQNIDALEQSSKTSHRKLLRIVKKLRTFLNEPVTKVVAKGPLLQTKSTGPAVKASNLSIDAIPGHGEPWGPNIGRSDTWTNRPMRFRNAFATAQMMAQKAPIRDHGLRESELLQDFLYDLSSTISELRKETPRTLTEENTDEIKFLTSKKRKLLHDTIRQLRHFGFRTGLSTATIADQESLSRVFALSRVPESKEGVFDFDPAEQKFFMALHLAPRVRQAVHEHSSDISREDVQRCAALFEGMLHRAITQRNRSSDAVREFLRLEGNLQVLGNMVTASRESKLLMSPAGKGPASTYRSLGFLIPVLNVGSRNIKEQAGIGQLDRTSLISSLLDYSVQLTAMRTEYTALPLLPEGMTSFAHLEWEQKTEKITTALRHELAVACENFPEVTIMVDKITPWIAQTVSDGVDLGAEKQTAGNEVDPATLQTIFDVCDAMLVSVQDVGKAVETLPTSTDAKSWLTKSEVSLQALTAGLHLESTSARLETLLESLSSSSQQSIASIGPIIASVLPIISQFRNTSQEVVLRNANYYSQLCAVIEFLAQTFSKLAADGFCNPQEVDNDAEAGSEKLESGTGLGEGDASGANNISGEIEEGEELEDIEESGEKKEGEDAAGEKDAVEMGEDDNNGRISDVSDSEREDGDQSEDDDDIGEDVGEFDDNDPDAVDEKMWDEAGDNTKETKEQDKKGSKQNEAERAEGDNTEQDTQEGETEEFDGELELEDQQQDDQRPVQDHDILDMPEDLDMDGGESTASEDSLDRTIEEDMLPEDTAAPKETQGSPEPDDSSDAEGVEDPRDQDIEDEMELDQEEKEMPPEETEDRDGMDIDDIPQDQSQEQTSRDAQSQPDDTTRQPETTAQDLTTNPQEQDTENHPAETKPSTSATYQQNDEQATENISGAEQAPENAQSDGQQTEEIERFKRLGDVLEKWYNKQVKNSAPRDAQEESKTEQDISKAELSHLQEDDEQDDGQALGTASMDQLQALDRRQGIDVDVEDEGGEPLSPPSSHGDQEDETMDDSERPTDAQVHPSGSNATTKDFQPDEDHDADAQSLDDLDLTEDMDQQLSTMELEDRTPRIEDLQSLDTARALWRHDEAKIRPLALALTEQLRLILEPTLASKMRGDFRTGKRLNIRRIIPYIASGYKRDKIWMRRSIPTRRTYQILLALDDSKSMLEDRSWELALESTALVSTSLSMLEAGELAVVGFGEDVNVVHEFGKSFSPNTGAEAFQKFTFQQSKTDVTKLLKSSIGLLRDARARQSGSAAELWQLMIVMSDGHCEDHERLRALVRQAQEERVMVVFVVLGAVEETGKGASEKKSNILNLRSAEFVQDANGETKVVWRNYFDTFPFQWYALVQNIDELPSVLANALRQWFAEVAVTGG